MAQVRLVAAAIEDLDALNRSNKAILRAVLKKLVLLSINPNAGEPLLGELVTFRKLTVGNRQWRIVWRNVRDASGAEIIEVAQIWGVGARKDSEIYEEMKRRIEKAPKDVSTQTLTVILEKYGHVAKMQVASTSEENDPAPAWLLKRLHSTLGYSAEETKSFSAEQAMSIWESYLSRNKD